MKCFVFYLILTIGLTAFAKRNDSFLKNHKFWQSHKVQKHDSLSKILLDLNNQGIVSGTLADLEEKILARNPHITNKNLIPTGTYILIPMTGPKFVPQKLISKEITQGSVNNFNFYYQPTIINNFGKKKAEQRTPAMTRLKVKEPETHISRSSSWSFEAFFSYSQLKTNVLSGGEIKLTSNENYGLGIGYAIPIGWTSLVNFYMHGFFEDYAQPSGITNLDNPQPLLKTLGTSLILPMTERWLFATHFEIKENLYAIPGANSISLKSTYQPHLGALLSYGIFEGDSFGSEIAVQATYISTGIDDDFESKDGLSLRGIMENRVTLGEQNFYLQFWYERKNTKTQTTEAQADYLGLTFGWQN